MLILTRKEGESFLLGDDIKITLTRSSIGKAQIGIEAPDHVDILREELLARGCEACGTPTWSTRPLCDRCWDAYESETEAQSQIA